MALDEACDVALADLTEAVATGRARLTQEQANQRQMADNGRCHQTSFLLQILVKRLEDLLVRCKRLRDRWRDYAHLSKHRQLPLLCRPIARLYGLLPGSMPKVPFHQTFIEVR